MILVITLFIDVEIKLNIMHKAPRLIKIKLCFGNFEPYQTDILKMFSLIYYLCYFMKGVKEENLPIPFWLICFSFSVKFSGLLLWFSTHWSLPLEFQLAGFSSFCLHKAHPFSTGFQRSSMASGMSLLPRIALVSSVSKWVLLFLAFPFVSSYPTWVKPTRLHS